MIREIRMILADWWLIRSPCKDGIKDQNRRDQWSLIVLVVEGHRLLHIGIQLHRDAGLADDVAGGGMEGAEAEKIQEILLKKF